MIEAMLGTLFGGIFRMTPEVLKWLDREDLRFGKRMRKAADHGLLAMMGVIAAAAMAAVWAGIVSKVGGH